MAPTIEQALRAEIQSHKQALDHAIATLGWLTMGHNERPCAANPNALKCRACEERDRLRLHLAGWAAPTEGDE